MWLSTRVTVRQRLEQRLALRHSLCFSSLPGQGVAGRRWEKAEERRDFLDKVKAKHTVEKPEDWRRVSVANVIEEGGASLLSRYRYSLLALLRDTYPEEGHSEEMSRGRYSKAYWEKAENRRAFLDQVAAETRVSTLTDWQRVTRRQIVEKGGGGLLLRYATMEEAIRDVYAEELVSAPSDTEVTKRRARGHWLKAENQRAFLEDFRLKRKLETPGDWKTVTVRDVAEAGGGRLLRLYGNSVYQMLQSVWPEEFEGLSEADFRLVKSSSYWEDADNQQRFLMDVGRQLGLRDNTRSSWRDVTRQQVEALGGSALLKRFPSFSVALEEILGREEEDDSFFEVRGGRKMAPKGHWKEESNVGALLEAVRREFRVAEPGDWARISLAQVASVGGKGLLNHMSLREALQKFLPDEWEKCQRAKRSKTAAVQRQLCLHVSDIFQPHAHI